MLRRLCWPHVSCLPYTMLPTMANEERETVQSLTAAPTHYLLFPACTLCSHHYTLHLQPCKLNKTSTVCNATPGHTSTLARIYSSKLQPTMPVPVDASTPFTDMLLPALLQQLRSLSISDLAQPGLDGVPTGRVEHHSAQIKRRCLEGCLEDIWHVHEKDVPHEQAKEGRPDATFCMCTYVQKSHFVGVPNTNGSLHAKLLLVWLPSHGMAYTKLQNVLRKT